MTTRREFIKGAAASGLVFCTCGLLDAACIGGRRHVVVADARHLWPADEPRAFSEEVRRFLSQEAFAKPTWLGSRRFP